MLYKKERILRTNQFPHKSILLRNSLDLKQFFLDDSTGIDDEEYAEDPVEYIHQYYATCVANHDQLVTGKRLKAAFDIAARCYSEGFLWHTTYLEVCAAKSAFLRQQYVTKLQNKSQASKINYMNKSVENNRNNTSNSNNSIEESEASFFTNCSEENFDEETDEFDAKFNALNLNNSHGQNQSLPTIILTDYSNQAPTKAKNSETSDQEIFYNGEQLTIPNIRCRIESRPPNN